jgi:hypothetical protein
LTVDIAAYSQAGSAAPVTVTLLDKYGNGIDTAAADGLVSVTVTGPGFTTTIADNTNASGQIKFNVILGSADTGSISVTANYDSNGSTANVTGTTVLLSATKVSAVGSAPVAGAKAAIAGSTKRFFVSVDGNSSARNVVVKVAGKTFKTLKGSTAKKTYVVAAPKGSHKVTVFVGGKLVATKTISVK